MNQAELIAAIAQANQHTTNKTTVKAILDAQADIVHAQLAIGGDVTLPGLGKFSVARRAARTGRNPATGAEIQIAARDTPKFSAAKALKDAANG